MALLYVNGAVIAPDPSKMDVVKQDISGPDAGRTLDGRMHKDKIAEKVKLSLAWNGIDAATAAAIVAKFSSEYVTVTYFDAFTNGNSEKLFYTGDMTGAYKYFGGGKRILSQLAFDIIEV